mgnify:CR=1 FL=1
MPIITICPDCGDEMTLDRGIWKCGSGHEFREHEVKHVWKIEEEQ